MSFYNTGYEITERDVTIKHNLGDTRKMQDDTNVALFKIGQSVADHMHRFGTTRVHVIIYRQDKYDGLMMEFKVVVSSEKAYDNSEFY